VQLRNRRYKETPLQEWKRRTRERIAARKWARAAYWLWTFWMRWYRMCMLARGDLKTWPTPNTKIAGWASAWPPGWRSTGMTTTTSWASLSVTSLNRRARTVPRSWTASWWVWCLWLPWSLGSLVLLVSLSFLALGGCLSCPAEAIQLIACPLHPIPLCSNTATWRETAVVTWMAPGARPEQVSYQEQDATQVLGAEGVKLEDGVRHHHKHGAAHRVGVVLTRAKLASWAQT